MRNKQFGKIGVLTKQQSNRTHFSDIPIGEKFIVLNLLSLPAYNALAYFINYPPQILENGEKSYTGYVERGTWEVIGNLFDNPELIQ
jgi:hypothetical protein